MFIINSILPLRVDDEDWHFTILANSSNIPLIPDEAKLETFFAS